jgi:hypothetical protein
MKYPKTITDIRKKKVAFTGRAWTVRKHLKRLVTRAGGIFDERVTAQTDVLVRGGASSFWIGGQYGVKEERLRDLIQSGESAAVLVHANEFERLLLQGKPAKTVSTIAGWTVPGNRKPSAKALASGEAGPESYRFPKGKLDWERTTKARREQALLRKMLLGDQGNHRCALCGLLLPPTLLVAAHRKRRSRCNDTERRDARALMFALCVFGCDALYERGFIAILEDGTVQIARVKGPPALAKALETLIGRTVTGLDDRSRRYHAWHRENVFRR